MCSDMAAYIEAFVYDQPLYFPFQHWPDLETSVLDYRQRRELRGYSCFLFLVMFVLFLVFVGFGFLFRSSLGHKLLESHEIAFFLRVTFSLS